MKNYVIAKRKVRRHPYGGIVYSLTDADGRQCRYRTGCSSGDAATEYLNQILGIDGFYPHQDKVKITVIDTDNPLIR